MKYADVYRVLSARARPSLSWLWRWYSLQSAALFAARPSAEPIAKMAARAALSKPQEGNCGTRNARGPCPPHLHISEIQHVIYTQRTSVRSGAAMPVAIVWISRALVSINWRWLKPEARSSVYLPAAEAIKPTHS
jgi:hypothetical protein